MKKIILLAGLMFFCLQAGSPVYAKNRYISLAPATTEILFALGLNDEIVGVSSFCNYPEAAKHKEVAGTFSNPNVEKILKLSPDYIFCTGLEQAQTVEELKRLKLNVYVSYPSNMEELYRSIMEIGGITGKNKEAELLIAEMKNDIAQISAKISAIPENKRKKVFIEIWHEPLMTAGGTSLIDELIRLAGGLNIAHDLKRPYSIFSQEKVIELDPDCIILTYMDKEPPLKIVEQRFGWKNISAVKNKQVFNDIDPDMLLRPGPRVTQGIKKLYQKLYSKENEQPN